jgi:prefoldin subunit 5
MAHDGEDLQTLQATLQRLDEEAKSLKSAISVEEAAAKIVEYVKQTAEPLLAVDNPWKQDTNGGGCSCFSS